MDKGVYIYKSGGWKNANDNLDVRGINSAGDTVFGTPTISKVPKVFAYTSTGWVQIYPGTVSESAPPPSTITYSSSSLAHYQSCRTDGTNWGWRLSARTAGHGYFGQDWQDSGGQDMSLVNKEYMGWIDMGSRARNALPNASSVTNITSLVITVDRRNMTGLTGSPCVFSLALTNCTGPSQSEHSTSPNPFNSLLSEAVPIFSMPAGSGLCTVTVNLSGTSGTAIKNLFMRWMKGEGASLMMYNNERKSACQVWGSYGRWSRNYTKITSFKMKIQYSC